MRSGLRGTILICLSPPIKNSDGINRTVWHFGQGGQDYADDVYGGDRTLLHMGASSEAVFVLTHVLESTGGFLLENDCNDSDWKEIQPKGEYTLPPNAQFALDIATILGAKAVETFRPLFDDAEKLHLFREAITRRIQSGKNNA